MLNTSYSRNTKLFDGLLNYDQENRYSSNLWSSTGTSESASNGHTSVLLTVGSSKPCSKRDNCSETWFCHSSSSCSFGGSVPSKIKWFLWHVYIDHLVHPPSRDGTFFFFELFFVVGLRAVRRRWTKTCFNLLVCSSNSLRNSWVLSIRSCR